MPVSGYDPDDVDDALEELVDERDARQLLDEEEWAAYRDGESLVDLLEESEIHALLGDQDAEPAGERDE
jgi:hypothetical protein